MTTFLKACDDRIADAGNAWKTSKQDMQRATQNLTSRCVGGPLVRRGLLPLHALGSWPSLLQELTVAVFSLAVFSLAVWVVGKCMEQDMHREMVSPHKMRLCNFFVAKSQQISTRARQARAGSVCGGGPDMAPSRFGKLPLKRVLVYAEPTSFGTERQRRCVRGQSKPNGTWEMGPGVRDNEARAWCMQTMSRYSSSGKRAIAQWRK
ncbi:hypothetical protein PMIN04_008245, partial [Paraphaeosphaeria minitans]